MIEKQEEILVLIQKSNPKKVAVTYKIETVNDICQMITEENVDNFLSDFESMLRTCILVKGLNFGKDASKLQLSSFDWTDD